jgi:hypothetical protein
VRQRGLTVPLALALAMLASGCEGITLPKSWRLVYPRVLALRSEVVGEPERATPEPGEQVRVRVLIAGPEPIARLGYALQACAGAQGNGELPDCAAAPFAERSGVLGDEDGAPFADELTVTLELPGGDELGDATRVLVAGTACTEGDPRLPDEGAPAGRCQGGDAPPLTWFGHIEIARASEEYNLNPELTDDAITFDGDAWPPAPPGEDDAPPLAAEVGGEAHEIRADLRDSGRERADGEPEELLLSHFTSAGVLERRFSVLEVDDPDDHPLTVEWRSPRPPPGEMPMESAKLVFVLRDQRGGVAFTTRQLAIDAD